MTKIFENVRLNGVPVSDGVASGVLFFMDDGWAVPRFTILSHQVSQEIDRYRAAISSCRSELESLIVQLRNENILEAIDIIESQIQMLNDPIITKDIESDISSLRLNAETLFVNAMDDYISLFKNDLENTVYQRLADVKDLSNRILKHLCLRGKKKECRVPYKSIICSYEITPSQVAELIPEYVSGCVTTIGGTTSHVALIARAKNIPCISDIDMEDLCENKGDVGIIDGNAGTLIINPSEEELVEANRLHVIRPDKVCEHGDLNPSILTGDGVDIDVQANFETLSGVDLLKRLNVRNIGLLRSEFLFFDSDIEKFSESAQYEVYRKLVALSEGMEVSFRLFDIGNDKKSIFENLNEPNPALGCRSIRFLLKHRSIFVSQLRAVLRAYCGRKVKLLLPFVSDIDELIEAKQVIKETKVGLEKDGVLFAHEVKLGCMVEVPSFVIMCDKLVSECEFLSIGTNDLVQYTLAIDRSNPNTKYGEAHPSILRMIKSVVDVCGQRGVPVGLCGEVASDCSFTELLLGLGLRQLSCVPKAIPQIRTRIANIRISEAEKLANKVLEASTQTEVMDMVTASSHKDEGFSTQTT